MKAWRYHKKKEAQIFEGSPEKFAELEKEGWADNPGKLLTGAPLTTTDLPPNDEDSDFSAEQDDSPPNDEDSDPLENVSDDELKAAVALLKGEGLNMSSFMRALNIDPKSRTERKNLQPVFDRIIEAFGEKIEQQAFDWFLKDR